MNIVLFGLGPHAKRIYYPLLEKYQKQYRINLVMLVDLEDQKNKINKYLKEKNLKPKKCYLLPERDREAKTIDMELEKTLAEIKQKQGIDGVIISTEPKAHMKYARWAIKNDINVLTDKPLSSPVKTITHRKSAKQLYKDFSLLDKDLINSRTKFYVQCQRRYHDGYNFIWDYLDEFAKKYEVPLTYMDIYHADGMWNMPNEFFSRENHPYKYGYGKLLHSGYHFIDLFSWFNEINQSMEKHSANKLGVFAQSYRPYDFFHTLDQDFYRNNLKSNDIESALVKRKLVKNFGELDVNMLLRTYRKDTKICTASCNLMQNSFSRRAWSYLPEDTYKGNGRVRHERFNVQVSQLLNIQIHSYQSYEVKKKDVETQGVGNEDHFDIYLFRNSELVGGAPLEKITLGECMKRRNSDKEGYIGHNEEAREKCFIDFMEVRDSIAELKHHDFTNKLLSTVYECLVKESKGKIPYKEIKI